VFVGKGIMLPSVIYSTIKIDWTTMADGIITLTSSSFDETVKSSNTPILVDFWAEWCGPCKAIAPVLVELSAELAGKVTIAKLDVDAHGDIAQRFSVMSIPTLLIFNNGEVQKRLVGAKGKGQLLQELAEFLPASH
jgi:thioredoxin 1